MATATLFQGSLDKKGAWFGWSWSRRYFVLRGAQLEYFASEANAREEGARPLGSLVVRHDGGF